MSSTPRISSYEQACSRLRWEVPDSYNIVPHPFASCYITARAWVLNGRREV